MKIFIIFLIIILLEISLSFGIISNVFSNENKGGAISIKEITNFKDKLTQFVTKYDRSYSSTNELTYRTLVFKQNLNSISNNNNDPKSNFCMGITRFGDLTYDEFKQTILMPKFTMDDVQLTSRSGKSIEPPKLQKNILLPPTFSFLGSNSGSKLSLNQADRERNTFKDTGLFRNRNQKNNWFDQSSSQDQKWRQNSKVDSKTNNKEPNTSTSSFKDKVQTKNFSIDWRQKNMSGMVKDQGTCGSCYAFAALGAIQSMYMINNMKTMGASGRYIGTYLGATLSQQHIIDCCDIAGKCDMGCDGGYVWNVFEFIVRNGVHLQETYPYRAHEGNYTRKCDGATGQFKKILDPSTPYTNVTKGNIQQLKRALEKGPVAVLMDADNLPFYVVNATTRSIPFSNCTSKKNNHAVLVVGVDEQGNWLIKNSWGKQWGDNGYITLAPGNTCGIANYAQLPKPYLI